MKRKKGGETLHGFKWRCNALIGDGREVVISGRPDRHRPYWNPAKGVRHRYSSVRIAGSDPTIRPIRDGSGCTDRERPLVF